MSVPKSRRKYADRTRWVRVSERKFSVKTLKSEAFTGALTRLELLGVQEPLYKSDFGKRRCVADAGYTWLQHFPKGERYCLTSQFDRDGEVVRWYLDLADRTGLSEEGIPWWDDVYLDIVVVPSGRAKIVDEADLRKALAGGKIGKKAAGQARQEAKRLKALIDRGAFSLLALSKEHFKDFDQL